MNSDDVGVFVMMLLGLALLVYWCWDVVMGVLTLQLWALVLVLVWAGIEWVVNKVRGVL